jgi:hypothetical protein
MPNLPLPALWRRASYIVAALVLALVVHAAWSEAPAPVAERAPAGRTVAATALEPEAVAPAERDGLFDAVRQARRDAELEACRKALGPAAGLGAGDDAERPAILLPRGTRLTLALLDGLSSRSRPGEIVRAQVLDGLPDEAADRQTVLVGEVLAAREPGDGAPPSVEVEFYRIEPAGGLPMPIAARLALTDFGADELVLAPAAKVALHLIDPVGLTQLP